MLRLTLLTSAAIACFVVSPTSAQESGKTPQQPSPATSFESASTSIEQKLEASLADLDRLRVEITADRLPQSRKLADLEVELLDVRQRYQQAARAVDGGTQELSNMRTEFKALQDDATYLSNLFREYVQNFESRLHIAETSRYRDVLDAAHRAPESTDLSEREVFAAQAAVLSASLDRLEDALGGTSFTGVAVDEAGELQRGTFTLVGPSALFRSERDGKVGLAEQRLNSLEASVLPFGEEGDRRAAAELATSGAGLFPMDPTLGNASQLAATEDTFVEHVQKGGPVMIPIFVMAGAALLVALYKWISLMLVRRPSKRQLAGLLQAIEQHDQDEARERARAIRGPIGRMLETGAEHLHEPRELVEEVMFEDVMKARLRLNGFLPFIAICAASAPLLGLLGTVTGIINTFQLITVFGSGDVKTLSGGISEALITTKFGLIVAIPSLLLHAYLSRKARRISGAMEAAGVAFVNQLTKSPFARERRASVPAAVVTERSAAPAPVDAAQVRAQVHEILHEMLGPLSRNGDDRSARTGGSVRIG